jgi:hypothetical protein
VLKTAHHGSANGTQWERIHRLGPRCIIVSSDPEAQHDLPDLVGASIFAKLEAANQHGSGPRKIVALTRHTGTIEIEARSTGGFDAYRYSDIQPDDQIDRNQRVGLRWDNNPTDWGAVLSLRVQSLHG